MRIDYSEPKKSCSSPQPGQSRPRRESPGVGVITVIISSIISLGIGFGGGWTLSQKSAKKGFKAAMEQQSLENTPQTAKTQPLPPQQPSVSPPLPATTQQQAASTQQPVVGGGPQSAAEPPLSFYKTLPSGQKNNVMGSGINSKDEKLVKQPLQAAMPTNITKAVPLQSDGNGQKQLAPALPVKPAVATHSDVNGLTVQVASYSLKSEAETMRLKLAAKGYNVNIAESHLGDKGTWYRVRVGRHLDQDAAKELAGKLGKGAIAIPDKE